MTDFDADEPVAPMKRREAKVFWTSDRIIGYSGVALALTAAFFPWYVFVNGVRSTTDATSSFLARNIPDWSGSGASRETPTGSIGDGERAGLVPGDPGSAEEIITGTVPKDKMPGKNDADAVAQPFPAEPVPFHLLHVSKGRALIEDANGVYIVGPGNVLPDLSKVSSVEQRDGDWVIVTDKGDIYDAGGKRK